MKGSTGANTSTVISLVSNSSKAVNSRQRRLKVETRLILSDMLRARRISAKMSNPAAYMTKCWQNIRAANDMRSNIEYEQPFTLVKNGTEPIRHQMMSARRSRHFNRLNRINSIPLQWMQGKQPLQTKAAK